MPGVTHVQLQASLHYDDGFVVTLSTPLWHKDIRDGDFFNAEMLETIIASAGQGLANIIEQEGLAKLYYDVKQRADRQAFPRKPHGKPMYGDDFSPN